LPPSFMRHNLKTRLGRLIARLDMYLVDHGAFRALYNNLHHLGGGMYRLSQPSPSQLRRYRKTLGIRTVLNLRGENLGQGSYALEADACRRLGLKLISFSLGSRRMPRVDEVLALREAFQTIEYPAMLHCKSGADRAGLASALYRHFHLGEPIEKLTELSWRYGHFQFGNTGRLDYFFEAYLAAHRAQPIEFMDWVQKVYDPEALQAEYDRRRKSRLGIWFVDKVLRRE